VHEVGRVPRHQPDLRLAAAQTCVVDACCDLPAVDELPLQRIRANRIAAGTDGMWSTGWMDCLEFYRGGELGLLTRPHELRFRQRQPVAATQPREHTGGPSPRVGSNQQQCFRNDSTTGGRLHHACAYSETLQRCTTGTDRSWTYRRAQQVALLSLCLLARAHPGLRVQGKAGRLRALPDGYGM
jgi:hypothetical protein